jgi:hypothetical protein
MLIEAVSLEWLVNNRLLIYQQNDIRWFNQVAFVTKTRRIRQAIEVDRCEKFDDR